MISVYGLFTSQSADEGHRLITVFFDKAMTVGSSDLTRNQGMIRRIDDALQQLGNDLLRMDQAGLMKLDELRIAADVDDHQRDLF